MSPELDKTDRDAMEEASKQLRQAAAAKKCWICECLHNSLVAIERAFPIGQRPTDLNEALRTARERLADVRYECLGCEVCYPALAINALNRAGGDLPIELDACPTDEVEEQEGWPPLPGAYTVLRYQAPIAVCTLTADTLFKAVAQQAGPDVAIVGTLQTENLGIERLILNVLANPNIRFLLVCGADSRQAIGHLPGQSIVALARWGIDDRGRIIEAKGKHPIVRNISREAIEHFRRTVEIVDLVGNVRISAVVDAVRASAAKNPGAAEPFARAVVVPVTGYLPERMITDPAGYFVVYVDQRRQLLSLEHYRNNGVLDTVIEGRTAAELYIPAIEKGLVSRLDHASYLGRELARAEHSLLSGRPYVQDAAPEGRTVSLIDVGCGCSPSCAEAKS